MCWIAEAAWDAVTLVSSRIRPTPLVTPNSCGRSRPGSGSWCSASRCAGAAPPRVLLGTAGGQGLWRSRHPDPRLRPRIVASAGRPLPGGAPRLAELPGRLPVASSAVPGQTARTGARTGRTAVPSARDSTARAGSAPLGLSVRRLTESAPLTSGDKAVIAEVAGRHLLPRFALPAVTRLASTAAVRRAAGPGAMAPRPCWPAWPRWAWPRPCSCTRRPSPRQSATC